MDKKWEIQRVSTPERIFDKINNEMAQPVGIMLFGADCELKDDVLEVLQAMSSVKVFHGTPSTHEMAELIHSSQISLFVLSSMESCDHALRHECVKIMRRLGAKSVIGVYAKTAAPKNSSYYQKHTTKAKREQARRCVSKLNNNPPTADGLDYLLVVSEEKEG